MDRESDAKQRGHRRHRRRHRRVLSEDAGAAEHDPNLGRAKTASGQMAEGGVQQPSAVPPTAASDTAPPSSMLTSNSLRLSSTAPFSGAPPGRILAAAGKHVSKYAWCKRRGKICQRDGPETPETPPRSAAGTPALSARSRRLSGGVELCGLAQRGFQLPLARVAEFAAQKENGRNHLMATSVS